jgi:hypothetical protein
MLASSSTPLPGWLRSWADREHPDFRMARFTGNPTSQNGRPVQLRGSDGPLQHKIESAFQ